MSKFRRGIVNHQPAGAQVAAAPKPIGRAYNTTVGHEPAPAYEPGVILNQQGAPANAPRRGLVTPGGQPVRGLAKATIDARVTQQQIDNDETEQCNRCGNERLKNTMVTLVNGHHDDGRSGAAVRVCQPCKRQTYRNPQDGTTEHWEAQQQSVRFDQRTGAPIDGRQVSLGELVNGDTYHRGDLTGQTEPDAGPRFDSGRVGKIRG